jgi:hypothetical protein
MTDRIILYGLIGIAVSITLGFLTKATGEKIKAQSDGKVKLRINILYGIIGILSLIFCIGFIIFFLSINDESTVIGLIIMFGIFGFPGIVCTLYYFNHNLLFDNKTITVKNMYGQTNTASWIDINYMNFNAITGLITIKTKNRTLKVHQHLVGLSSFIEKVEKNTNWSAKSLKIPINQSIKK